MEDRNIELQWVERLAHTLQEYQLHKIELETEDVELTLRASRRQPAPPAVVDAAEEIDVEEADVVLIRSKDVGLFRPASDLEAGGTITHGQKVATVEAVSVVHDVVSEYQGTLVDILVQDGDPVEYGQPLFVLSESES